MAKRPIDQDDHSEAIRRRAISDVLSATIDREEKALDARMARKPVTDAEFKANAKGLIKQDAAKGIFHDDESVEERLRKDGYPLEADRRRAERLKKK
jgi:hypothetical protein